MDDSLKVLACLSNTARNLVEALTIANGRQLSMTGDIGARVVLSPEAFSTLLLALQNEIHPSNRKGVAASGSFSLCGVRFEREGDPA